mmetsp:Transcript_35999/g.81294  ORF Transcript_35999/g.81294 Transcript_35999/m.81294 type:complete len:778 (+) Transcript_35999:86-2419(+)
MGRQGAAGEAVPSGAGAPKHSSKANGASIRKILPLACGAVIVGLLTTMSAVVIDLTAAIFADMRHGLCIQRVPGDERPLWLTTLRGNWRPYDRTRCCGGSMLVDHAMQQCRAPSIIQHSAQKRFATPIHSVRPFGRPIHQALTELQLGWEDHQPTPRELSLTTEHEFNGNVQTHAARSANVDKSVGDAASQVRSHISHGFGPDPTESWAEETKAQKHIALAEDTEYEETSVNEDAVQTYSESIGELSPYNEWVPWERALGGSGHTAAMLIYVAGSGLLATIAAVITLHHPAAKGSGIPEVKARVAGAVLPASFLPQTLLAKLLALSLCVGAGLAVGKEGPLIHIGACWGLILARPLLQLRQERSSVAQSADLEFICIGAAAGVAAAFGAPLAGVLFVVEELGTNLPGGVPHATMLCAFSSAALAALALKWLDMARTQRLTLFEVDYKQVWAPWEAVPFCVLGAVGGLVGGTFVRLNAAVHRKRLACKEAGHFTWFLPSSIDSFLHRRFSVRGTEGWVLEVSLLAVLTALSNYPHALTRMLQNDAISSLFAQCPQGAAGVREELRIDPVGFCMEEGVGTLALLLSSAALRLMQTTVTFGALVPAGLFVPSLYIGGCFGRALGVIVKRFGPLLFAVEVPIEPGIYAMVGAGAMLAGVSRLTVSLAVVLVELTGGLTYVVPFMLAVLIAKWVGDSMTDGQSVYDIHSLLNGLVQADHSDEVDLGKGKIAVHEAEDVPTMKDGGQRDLWLSNGAVCKADLQAQCLAACGALPLLKPHESAL